MVFEVGAPPPKIDAAILSKLKRADIGGYAPNPKKRLRNQVESTRDAASGSFFAPPKFLSEKAREGQSSQKHERRLSDAADIFDALVLDGSTKTEVPIMYRNVEIKYSKFGVDDFDFQ